MNNDGLLDRVTATGADNRRAIIRRRAKELTNFCRANNIALKINDDFFDSISDEEWLIFKERLVELGMVQRDDFRWEYNRG